MRIAQSILRSVSLYVRSSLRKHRAIVGAAIVLGLPASLPAQTPVLTQHNNNARNGAYTTETTLTPANVNQSSFGKLFAFPVDGHVYAQPLYVPGVTISGKGTHSVVFAVTEHDSVYAFDADSNGGGNAIPLWQITLLDAAHGAASGATTVPNGDLSTTDIVPEIGITGTPVIDSTTGTLYVVGKTKEGTTASPTYVQRLHALDITSGAEKFGGPVTISASVPGTGNGSSGGTLAFDPKWQNQRAGLLLQNGVLYMAFGSHGDNGPWHGWVLSYNAATLHQISIYCTTPSGSGSGTWMAGSGLAAEIVDPVNKPYGRMFIATGNGSFSAAPPYTNAMSYGDDIVNLDLTGGTLTVQDSFTPNNQASLNTADLDVASGGVLLLPDQSSGGHTHLLVQVGKEGKIYLVDRDNMGGYNSTADNAVEEIAGQSGGLWSMPAFWNNTVYTWGVDNYLMAFGLSNGLLSATPTTTSAAYSGFPGATPSISANGTTNGIVWVVRTDAYNSSGNAVLYAFNATNVASELYDSTQNPSRDTAGIANKFAVPTIANGKVYVGTANELDVYGTLNGPTAAAPVISPGSESFNGSLSVTITDSTSGATIFYTTDGSTPTTSSAQYTGPITVSTTETVTAIASATGYIVSPATSQNYTLQNQVIAPTSSPASTTFTSTVSVTLSDATSGAKIYYTTDGSSPSTASTLYSSPVTISSTTTLKAMAAVSGMISSNVSTAVYTLASGGTGGTFANGFASAPSFMTFNGSTKLDDSRLQLTDGGAFEAGTAWFNTQVNIQSFTSDFTFQLSNPNADGFTFTIQNAGLNALGPYGGGLGYGPYTCDGSGSGGIATSIAIKFDLYSNCGEGTNSTGLYTNGAAPTMPAIDMTGSGIYLHSGDTFKVHMVYNGTNLTMTLTDGVTNASFTTSWSVNIPQIVGGNMAYVGFTGGTGGSTASQKIESWTFTSTQLAPQVATPSFSPAGGTYSSTQTVSISTTPSGAAIYYTLDGSTPATSAGGSTFLYSSPISVSSTTTVKAIATASGYLASPVSTAVYTISAAAGSINFGNGFAAGGMIFNGSAALNGTRLRLTDGGTNEASTAWYSTPVNISAFTNDFSFQITPGTSPLADGLSFIIQNGGGTTAIGPLGGGLGYGPYSCGATSGGIPNSVAIKFDLYSNCGEGADSTGLYTAGASPTTPYVDLTSTGIDLHSGHVFNVHMTYDGTNLAMTITDATTTTSYAYSWPINLASTVGAATAYVGFGGGTGGYTAIQDIISWTYAPGGSTPTAATPTFSPAAGTYTSAQSVTISDGTSGATIYYTRDGSTPTTFSTKYSGAISVSSTTTINAIAAASGYNNSAIASATYTIQVAAATPTFSPTAGTYGSAQSVTISDATSGASIYYTADGSTPTTSSTKYSTAISASSTTTVKAIAAATGYSTSAVASATYTINFPVAATPTFSPAAGTYASAQFVTISDSTSGATIYYTTNGSTPTTSSTKYTGAISVSSTTTINVIAAASGYNNSAVASAAYTIQGAAATPTFSPAAGTYSSAQSVTISDSTSGASIYYTTDGSTPTTSSSKYTTAIPVSSTTTLNALAAASGYTNSAVASATYTINLPTAATPTFSPAGGTYASAQSVTISDVTSSATIYYTTDGTTPTIGSTKYTGAIAVSSTTTLKAMAAASGYINSAVGSASYTISSNIPISFASGFNSSAGLQFNGGSALSGTRLRITDGGTDEAHSAFWSTPVNEQSFTTDFTFQQAAGTTPTSDGFAFVLQNTGVTSLGPGGGGLGYGPMSPGGTGGIVNSIAIKFDLYDNAGEGPNSTGLYVNGASPTIPAVDVTGSGVNLHSGDLMRAHITYDGATLALTITDTVTSASVTTAWAINIPSAIGSNTAYAGFTGATGGQTAVQDILTWQYSLGTTKTPIIYWTPNLTAVSSGPTFRTFGWSGFYEGSGTILDATAAGQSVTFTVNVPQAGTYNVAYTGKSYTTRGTLQLSISGANVGPVTDQYTASVLCSAFNVGNFTFPAAGSYSFKFTVTGKDSGSSGYSISFDDIILTPQ